MRAWERTGHPSCWLRIDFLPALAAVLHAHVARERLSPSTSLLCPRAKTAVQRWRSLWGPARAGLALAYGQDVGNGGRQWWETQSKAEVSEVGLGVWVISPSAAEQVPCRGPWGAGRSRTGKPLVQGDAASGDCSAWEEAMGSRGLDAHLRPFEVKEDLSSGFQAFFSCFSVLIR